MKNLVKLLGAASLTLAIAAPAQATAVLPLASVAVVQQSTVTVKG